MTPVEISLVLDAMIKAGNAYMAWRSIATQVGATPAQLDAADALFLKVHPFTPTVPITPAVG